MSKKKQKKNYKKNQKPRTTICKEKDGVGFFLMEVNSDYVSNAIRSNPENWLEVLVDECTFEMGGNIKLPITEPHAYEMFQLDDTETTQKIHTDFCCALISTSEAVRLFCHRDGRRYFSTNLEWDTIGSLFQLAHQRNGLSFNAITINQDA